LLATVLVRPTWCPRALCPAPVTLTNPSGAHDDYLELVPTAVQSATYLIPGDPSLYTLQGNNLPHEVGVVRIDDAAYPPYRVVLGVHSLQGGVHDGLLIEQITIVIDSVTAPPTPLDVWHAGAPLDYRKQPYQALYRGEGPGAQLQAFSTTTPPTQIYLQPGGSDEIDLRLVGRAVGAIRFHVQVLYRVTSQSTLHLLELTA
jgi:hypothetical protein